MTSHIKNFTTSLPISILEGIEEAAKMLRIPKNQVIINAFKEWDRARKQALVAESYSKAVNDREFSDLSNMGLDEWREQVN